MLTIIMYHYVRPIAKSTHPGVKGLEADAFRGQLDYLERQGYAFIRTEDVPDARRGSKRLPERSVLITFDDGYIDHFLYAYPELRKRGIFGAFFPPLTAIVDRTVLDVNKIHFILISSAETGQLVEFIDAEVRSRREEFSLKPVEAYRQELMKPNQWDPAEVIYVKRMLQYALPLPLRSRMVDELFKRHVTENEVGFANSLYANVDQLRLMHGDGMHIGGHGATHRWLNKLTRAEQEQEITQTKMFLLENGLAEREYLSFCYPNGGFNDETLSLMSAHGFKIGFTTKVGLTDLEARNVLTLPRLDTNHLPKTAAAPPNEWTQKAGFGLSNGRMTVMLRASLKPVA